MERHKKLIRWLLEHTEQKQSGSFSSVPTCPKFTPEHMHYHIGLCLQADYLTAEVISGAEERFPRYEIGSMTWAGHEALEKLREMPS